MRVGVLTTSYPRYDGDPAGSFVREHVRWLRSGGNEVEVVCAGDSSFPAQFFGEKVHRIHVGAGIFYRGGAADVLMSQGRAARLQALAFCSAQLLSTARLARRWDHAIGHWMIPSGVVLAAVRRGRPFTTVCHSGDVHLLVRSGWAEPAVRLIVHGGGRLVFSCHAVRDHLRDSLRSPWLRGIVADSVVQAMGIDAARFAEPMLPPIADRPKVVTFLGRLVPVKGLDVLLDAWLPLDGHATLRIIGDGPLAGELSRRVRGRGYASVELCGEVVGEELNRLLGETAVMVMPSVETAYRRSEGMPVAVLEAMAAGAAVVASRVGGLAELDSGVATLVEPGNAAALSLALGRLLNEPERRIQQAQRGRRLALQHDWNHIGHRFF